MGAVLFGEQHHGVTGGMLPGSIYSDTCHDRLSCQAY